MQDGQSQVIHCGNAAVGQTEKHQESVGSQVDWVQPTIPGVQVPQILMEVRRKTVSTGEGQSETCAHMRAVDVAEQFIVMLGALSHAVTNVVGMQAHHGHTTAVKAKASQLLTIHLILTAWTVHVFVAQDVDWEAETPV